MSLKFSFSLRVSPGNFKRVKVNDVNPNAKIGDLKVEAAKITNLPMESLELAFCGNILEDDQTVSDCGLKPGVTVHVMRKNIETVKQSDPMSEVKVKAISQAFRTISLDPAFRNALQMMRQSANLENLLTVTPALLSDPVAIAIIQDPELVMRMADFGTAKRMAELHPALLETADHIAGAVQMESARPTAPASNYNDSSFPYAMDDYSDEEEMDSSQSSDSVAGSSSRSGARGTITAPQLAAALASATAFQSPSTPRASASSGQSSASPAVITPEMVNQAMQSAIASVPPAASAHQVADSLNQAMQSAFGSNFGPFVPGSSNNGLMSTPPTTSSGEASNITQQIQQMHEMGLLDDVANMHALHITGGDVQAAINLVLSGAIPNEEDY